MAPWLGEYELALVQVLSLFVLTQKENKKVKPAFPVLKNYARCSIRSPGRALCLLRDFSCGPAVLFYYSHGRRAVPSIPVALRLHFVKLSTGAQCDLSRQKAIIQHCHPEPFVRLRHRCS